MSWWCIPFPTWHYSDVIMCMMASQITSISIIYSTVYSGADQRKHQSSASSALCAGNSPVTGEFPAQMQTPRKLFMLYRTENQFFTTFSNFKHGYIKKFYWSSHIFHWSSHFFISRWPRADKFCGVCKWPVTRKMFAFDDIIMGLNWMVCNREVLSNL